jgi:DNA-binding response OmpR family regulator
MDKTREPTGLTRRRTRKILVIDRSEETLALTTDLLEQAGFLALCQTSSAGATLFAVRESVDAALIDLDAFSRGDRVARALRAHASLSTLPIVLILSEELAQGERGALPGVVTLTKSLVPLALVPLLRSLINHRVENDARERRC